MIKFVSYDGKYPSLCGGTLKFSIDCKLYEIRFALCSGGRIVRTDDGDLVAKTGPWSINFWEEDLERFPELKHKHIQEELEDLVNEYVPHGCCGGCI